MTRETAGIEWGACHAPAWARQGAGPSLASMFDRQLAGALPLSRTARASAAFRRRWLPATCTGYRDTHPGLRLVGRSLSAAPAPRPQPVDLLTPCQREVAALITLGLTNRQIAE